jgi:hypothetical protein
MLISTTRGRRGRGEGDTVRKIVFELYLSWLLVFGGSPALLRAA